MGRDNGEKRLSVDIEREIGEEAERLVGRLGYDTLRDVVQDALRHLLGVFGEESRV